MFIDKFSWVRYTTLHYKTVKRYKMVQIQNGTVTKLYLVKKGTRYKRYVTKRAVTKRYITNRHLPTQRLAGHLA
jgi:hypothetical protein